MYNYECVGVIPPRISPAIVEPKFLSKRIMQVCCLGRKAKLLIGVVFFCNLGGPQMLLDEVTSNYSASGSHLFAWLILFVTRFFHKQIKKIKCFSLHGS